MGTTDSSRPGRRPSPVGPAVPPSGLLDLLSVAAVVLDSKGRVIFWSSHAEELFGYTAAEALGRFAARLMVHEEHWDEVVLLFARANQGTSVNQKVIVNEGDRPLRPPPLRQRHPRRLRRLPGRRHRTG
ncbi:PAS domain S-box protein, partial [Streptomyces sp. NPDC001215]